MSLEQMAVEQTIVLSDEFIEGLGAAGCTVKRHQMHPALSDRLVVFVQRAMVARDPPDG